MAFVASPGYASTGFAALQPPVSGSPLHQELSRLGQPNEKATVLHLGHPPAKGVKGMWALVQIGELRGDAPGPVAALSTGVSTAVSSADATEVVDSHPVVTATDPSFMDTPKGTRRQRAESGSGDSRKESRCESAGASFTLTESAEGGAARASPGEEEQEGVTQCYMPVHQVKQLYPAALIDYLLSRTVKVPPLMLD